MDILATAQLRADLRSGRARDIRQRARLSCAEIGKEIGSDASSVWAWETGRRVPRGENAERYADLLWRLDRLTREPA